jgi:hypothetical protein
MGNRVRFVLEPVYVVLVVQFLPGGYCGSWLLRRYFVNDTHGMSGHPYSSRSLNRHPVTAFATKTGIHWCVPMMRNVGV